MFYNADIASPGGGGKGGGGGGGGEGGVERSIDVDNERYIIDIIKESMRQHNQREIDYVSVLKEQILLLKDELLYKNKQIASLIKIFAETGNSDHLATKSTKICEQNSETSLKSLFEYNVLDPLRKAADDTKIYEELKRLVQTNTPTSNIPQETTSNVFRDLISIIKDEQKVDKAVDIEKSLNGKVSEAMNIENQLQKQVREALAVTKELDHKVTEAVNIKDTIPSLENAPSYERFGTSMELLKSSSARKESTHVNVSIHGDDTVDDNLEPSSLEVSTDGSNPKISLYSMADELNDGEHDSNDENIGDSKDDTGAPNIGNGVATAEVSEEGDGITVEISNDETYSTDSMDYKQDSIYESNIRSASKLILAKDLIKKRTERQDIMIANAEERDGTMQENEDTEQDVEHLFESALGLMLKGKRVPVDTESMPCVKLPLPLRNTDEEENEMKTKSEERAKLNNDEGETSKERSRSKENGDRKAIDEDRKQENAPLSEAHYRTAVQIAQLIDMKHILMKLAASQKNKEEGIITDENSDPALLEQTRKLNDELNRIKSHDLCDPCESDENSVEILYGHRSFSSSKKKIDQDGSKCQSLSTEFKAKSRERRQVDNENTEESTRNNENLSKKCVASQKDDILVGPRENEMKPSTLENKSIQKGSEECTEADIEAYLRGTFAETPPRQYNTRVEQKTHRKQSLNTGLQNEELKIENQVTSERKPNEDQHEPQMDNGSFQPSQGQNKMQKRSETATNKNILSKEEEKEQRTTKVISQGVNTDANNQQTKRRQSIDERTSSGYHTISQLSFNRSKATQFGGAREKLAYIFTDRLCKDMRMSELNTYLKNIKVYMKCFPNTDAKELKGYIAPILNTDKPDVVLINVGQNDVKKEKPAVVAAEITSCVAVCREAGVSCVLVSGVVGQRGYRSKARDVNLVLEHMQKEFGFRFVNNENMAAEHLWKDRCHLNEKGQTILENNFITAFNDLDVGEDDKFRRYLM